MQPDSVGFVAKGLRRQTHTRGHPLALRSAQTSVKHTPEPAQHRIELGWREDSPFGVVLFSARLEIDSAVALSIPTATA